MSVISKDCFLTPTKCYNCERKHFNFSSDDVTRNWNRKNFKRCSGCHLFTYCDEDCQREHWTKIHKKHCKFLSGKKLVANSEHSSDSCVLCAEEKTACGSELASDNSPKTDCHVEQVVVDMLTILGLSFDFHDEDKTGHCHKKFASELPFPMGEVSGEYVDKNFGLDTMLAHTLKTLNAMALKDKQRSVHLNELRENCYWTRVNLWYDLMVYGQLTRGNPNIVLVDEVLSLKDIYGSMNPWWIALAFTVGIIENTLIELRVNFTDTRSLDDPKFETLKRRYEMFQSRLNKKVIVSERNMWSRFKLWPSLVNGSLVILLPAEAACANCSDPLSGPLLVTKEDNNFLPTLITHVGENGSLMVCCSDIKNPRCIVKSVDKFRLSTGSKEQKKFEHEVKLFYSESRICDTCLKSSVFSHRCTGCLAAQYCSTLCQHKDLDFHKTVCSKWAKDKSRKIISGGKQRKLFKSLLQVNK